MVGFKERR